MRPQSVEEIGQVTQKQAELSRRIPEVEPLFLEAERKNKLLRSVAGGGVEQLSELKTRWDKFEIMMESHQMMIKDQVSTQSVAHCTLHIIINYFSSGHNFKWSFSNA